MMKKKTRNDLVEALYVHIPFCKSICSYCDFTKFYYNEDYAKRYVNVLIQQIKNDDLPILNTIYIGGGTPSSLTTPILEKLLSFLSNYLSENYEFTIEVNPETIDEEKAKLFKKYKINRVSIGVQTFNERLLKLLGREHSKKEVINTVELLIKNGIENYSFDFIYGINSQTLKDIEKDINESLKLKPKHYSFYSLTIEPHTKLYIDNYKELEEEKVREMYDFIYLYLEKYDYYRYEVSNFAIMGYESRHNLTYWKNKPYYAYGVGASCYLNGVRASNSKNLKNFLNNKHKKEEIIIQEKDKEFEYIMLRLRLKEGINLLDYQKEFNYDFNDKYKKAIDKLLKNKLLIVKENNIKATNQGFMLLNQILLEFMD